MTPPSLSALGGWAELPFFAADWPRIAEQLAAEPREILPPAPKIFAALEHLQPAAVEVVILGQDPYPTPGHAQGYAFSAEPHVRPIPRSLANIFKELHDDLGAPPEDPDLRFWADQGVLLLNNV
ncbi:MAG TPA: uracil-DNA glycosylase, partial [Sulfitobacter sp.]|nr:uracil-DNA glycosylase [Sulfitobacter sp.]